jgi:uncharacterized RDD family membrane protein YckC
MVYAGVGLRAVAVIIDFVMLFAIMFLVALVTGNTSDAGFELQGAPAGLGFVLWFVYFVAMEATSGATLGKMLVGIKVVRTDGTSPIGWSPALIRNVLRIIDGLFVYLVGAFLASRSPTKQRLGDRVAGTVVVRKATAPQAASV